MLDYNVAQDSILVSRARSADGQLRKLGYRLICHEFNIVKIVAFFSSQKGFMSSAGS